MIEIKKNVNLYLKLLDYTKSDIVFFRAFTSDGKAKKASYIAEKIDYNTLQEWNNQGFGIYIVVNGGGQTDNDVKHCRAIFYEHDNLPKEQQKQLWQELNLPEPTIQVDTGGKSIHSYWVFDKPSSIEDWKSLQADLLEFSNGDRAIKNPSRVMRLPGFTHQKTGDRTEIISQHGKRYSYEDLRQAIPTQQKQALNLPTPAVTHLDTIPLENCLTKDDKALINSGESEGKRNNSGAKLARNLIGTANRLDCLGINYKGDPHQLFNSFCNRCTPPISSKEAQQIWISAEKNNPTATLTDDVLENCVKAWQRQKAVEYKPRDIAVSKQKSKVTQIKEPWGEETVVEEINELAKKRLNGSKLTTALKSLSFKSQWDIKTLEKLYRETIEELDREAELEDDEREFSEILSADEPLECSKVLPEQLHPLLKMAENLGVRPEAIVVAFEATASSLVNSATRVIGRNCSDYDQNPTIFSALVGEPGSKKSPIIRAIAAKPLKQMQQKAQNRYESERIEYERELAEWENQEKNTRGDKPTPPQERIYCIGDYTPEGLRELSQYNPKALRLFDELAREANSRGQYKGGKGGEAQQILESYDGYLHSTVRRNKNYSACAVNQPVLGGIQPDVLSKIMSSDDPTGEFARYNIAILPKKPYFWGEDSETPIDITPLLVSLYEDIDNLPPMTFRLSSEASKAFINCHNLAEKQAYDADKQALVYQYLKADGKILRLAMLYHIIYAVANKETPSEVIDKKFITIARRRMRYQINQVKALLARMDETIPSKLVQIHEYAKKKGELMPSQLKNAGYVKNAGEAIELFRRLEQMGWGKTFPTKRSIKFKPFEDKVDNELTATYGELTVDDRNIQKLNKSSNISSSGKATYGKAITNSKSDTANKAASTYGNYGHDSSNPKKSQEVDNPPSTHDTTYGELTVDDRNIQKLDKSSNTSSSSKETYGKAITNSNSGTANKAALTYGNYDHNLSDLKKSQEVGGNLGKTILSFNIGQKATYNKSPWFFVIAKIDTEKGFLVDKDGAAFDWRKCDVAD